MKNLLTKTTRNTPSLTRYDRSNSPLSMADDIFEDMLNRPFSLLPALRMFDTMHNAVATSLPEGVLNPQVDIEENDKAYTLTAELPGLEEKNISLDIVDNTLVLKGEKKQNSEEKGKHFHRTERAYGSFERRFVLPDTIQQDGIDATFKNGILTLTLPKMDTKSHAKRIAIKKG